MSVFHDEVEIEDFEFDADSDTFYFPCPCGDRFVITKEELESGEEEATCPSCSLIVRDLFMSGEVIDAPSSSETRLEWVRS
ncbi:hypothetical protein F2P81_002877 [Scophthalmus maximus]|uniref:Diphthamide biosynthesis protein 3 n=1 Tax=Scophthalmus maximus TaxID=52904 RepID=A0A6A4TPN5_SCOMX|nr:hypothetical protein F2P81_002877 [Scophthalmus maximus]